jgi:ribosomal protein S18 acetylase RimI-like enzyme
MAAMDTTPHTAAGTTSGAARRSAVAVRIATRGDLPEVLRVQHAAFSRVARSVDMDPCVMEPVRETLEDLQGLQEAGMRTLVAVDSDRVAGTVRGRLTADGTVEIGRLAVDDGFERRGIAAALMLALEDEFPDAVRFELYTAKEATGPIRLYERLGYSIFRERLHNPWDMVWLEKAAAAAPTAPADAPLH